MMTKPRKLVSFDWAIKRLLRSKANFDILEGFLSELLGDEIRILALLESESNRDYPGQKSNRLDLKVANHKNEIIIIEIQYEHEYDYFFRMMFATSRAVCEHLAESAAYSEAVKVISINILYFDLGHGDQKTTQNHKSRVNSGGPFWQKINAWLYHLSPWPVFSVQHSGRLQPQSSKIAITACSRLAS